MDYKYKVATRCFTYNHALFIEDTLNGFSMQKANFPMVYCIVDDASTDGEPDFLRRWAERELSLNEEDVAYRNKLDYGEIIVAPLKAMRNSLFVILLLNSNHKQVGKSKLQYLSEWLNDSKYIAICEGDDYWTDAYKLDKQASFLDENQDYTMCFHSAIEHWENGLKKDGLFSIIDDREYKGVELFKDWIVPTASVLIKGEVYDTDLYKKVKACKMNRGDTSLFCTAATLGKVRGMSQAMSVYRRNDGSFMFQKKTFDRLSHYIRDLRLFPVLFGEEYKKTALTHVGYTIVDTCIHSYLRKDVSFARKMMSLREPGDGFYLFKSFVTFPFRSFFNKYLRGLFMHRK